MKNLLLLLLLIPNALQATGEVATVATTTAPMSMQEMIHSAIFALVSAVLIFITNYAKDYLQQKTNEAKHQRGISVIKDSFYSAIADTACDIDVTLKNAKAKETFILCWFKISTVRLNQLSGFNKMNMQNWVNVQQTIFLGKYLEDKKNRMGEQF